jgi:tRNA threonylcarbamoyl adenosine modification protein YeaZ
VLLALDTATAHVSVAALDGDRVAAEHVSERSMQHGEQLAPLVDQCLREAGIGPDGVTAVAVGVGPGPFTGLRVGLVTARTLGMVLGVPVHGVCTLDVLALEAVETGAVEGEFVVATDARRKEVYLATYDASGARTSGPDVLRPAVAATDLPAVGAGALLYPDDFPFPAGPTQPSAAWLARGVRDGRFTVLPPEPLYLRRPDAVAGAPRKPVS